MAKKKPKFYVVWRGRKEGIFTSWAECQAQIQGFSGAQYKSFPSRSEAQAAFDSAYGDYVGVGGKKKAKKSVSPEAAQEAVTPSLSVDAACSGNPGVMEFRGVDTASGEELFRLGPFRDATNNIGEFLALVYALRMQHEVGESLPIYSDSRTGMAWVRNKKVNTTLEETDHNAEVFTMINEALDWLLTHTYKNTVLKWPTEKWGEIPADFGRK